MHTNFDLSMHMQGMTSMAKYLSSEVIQFVLNRFFFTIKYRNQLEPEANYKRGATISGRENALQMTH